MVVTQATGRGVVPTEEKIQRVRNIIAANDVIKADVADEIVRIGSAPDEFEQGALDEIDRDPGIPAAKKESEKTKKKRELAALSAYEANRGFKKDVKRKLR
jgi:hypothetical protein